MMTLMMKSSSQVVKLASCLTCPLCNKLFSEATTISECLHTFCRKCIFEKITDEELDNCPICNIDLGCAPLEKLRADHNLQDLRAKLFPPAIKKGKKTHDAVSSAPLTAKRKERSLSSLVITAPRASPQSCITERRKYPTRKSLAPRESALPVEQLVVKVEDCSEKFSSKETINGIAANGRQKSTNESFKQQAPYNNVVDNAKLREEKAVLRKRVNCVVEAASESKPNKANTQEGPVLPYALKCDLVHQPTVKVKKHGKRSRVHGYEKDSNPAQSGSVKLRKTQGLRQRRATVSEGFSIPAQSMENATSEFARRFSPIWFCLIASNDQDGDEPLPQISSSYLRVKDGSLSVSLVKKYLMKKLDLASEAEIEISLRGQPVIPTLQLHNLVDLWRQMAAPSSETIKTTAGSSGKDYVMVLTYGRKAQRSHKRMFQ